MPKKYLIVGGVAGGGSVAARLRRLSEEDQVVIFERGPNVSFSNCCLPYHLSGVVEKSEDLVLMCPDKFESQYNIDARVNQEVKSINRENKSIQIKNVLTGETYDETYDKLILSPGAKPVVPPIKGIEKANIFTVRNVVDIAKLNKHVKEMDSKDVVVIGGGFIGVECAENLREAGFNISLVEAMPQIMRPFDYDMVQILHKELHEHGVNLVVGQKVVEFDEKHVILDSGKKIKAGTVVLAIGVQPETDLASKAGLELGETRSIKVDQNYRTSDKDIYAVGDAIEVFHALAGKTVRLALAGPAQKQARAVADHIHGKNTVNTGVIGSSVIKVFDINGASTGLNENMIKAMNLDIKYDVVKVIPKDKVSLMPGSESLHFKLVYEMPTGRILGAQAIGKGNVDKRIDVIATAIKFGATVENLRDLELCYAPSFGTAKDVVNFAGYVASNLIQSDFIQVREHEVRDLVEAGAFIIDVREKSEYELSHIVNAINIPLSEIRGRLSEIPTVKPVYLYCRSAQRSYNALLALQNSGFSNIYNISGGFMGVSFYEYFNDQISGRSKIVTDYNFN